MTDWWNYGGLTREVKLIETPSTFVHDYLIQLQKGSRDRVSGWVKLAGDRLSQKVTIRIAEAGISKTFTTDEHGFAAVDFSADLKLWSPDNAPSAAEDPGLLEPEGLDLESRPEEESLLRATAVVSRVALTTDHQTLPVVIRTRVTAYIRK